MAVENVLKNSGIPYINLVLGRVMLKEKLDIPTKAALEQSLNDLGFEILQDKDVRRIEKVKNLLNSIFQQEEIPSGFNLSKYLKEHILEDYNHLSHLFSVQEGITIERFFIHLKIEKVKEWLFYEEMTLSEISYKLDYSSVQHLSAQFKKLIGMTPTAYKKLKYRNQKSWKDLQDS